MRLIQSSTKPIIRNIEERDNLDKNDVHYNDAKLLMQLYDYNKFPRIVKTREFIL